MGVHNNKEAVFHNLCCCRTGLDENYVRVGITPGELAHETGIDAHVVKGLMERLSQANIVVLEEKAINIKGIHKLKFLDFMEIEKGTGKI